MTVRSLNQYLLPAIILWVIESAIRIGWGVSPGSVQLYKYAIDNRISRRYVRGGGGTAVIGVADSERKMMKAFYEQCRPPLASLQWDLGSAPAW